MLIELEANLRITYNDKNQIGGLLVFNLYQICSIFNRSFENINFRIFAKS